MVLSIVSLLSTMCTLVYIHAVGGKSVVSDCYKSYERIRGWKSTSTLQRVPLVSYVVCVTRVPVMAMETWRRYYFLVALVFVTTIRYFFSDAIAFFNGTTCSFLDSRFLYGILVYFLGNRSAFRNSWFSFFPPFPINFLIIKYSSVLSVFYYIIAMWTRITCFLFHLVSFLKLWFSLWLVDEILLYFAFVFLLWY